MSTIEVKTSGMAVTRNGEFPVGAVRLELTNDKAKLAFVSGRLRRVLHAGCTIEAEAMDRLAVEWAKKRGLVGKWQPPVTEALKELDGVREGVLRTQLLLVGKSFS
jgi:hypothetical protein